MPSRRDRSAPPFGPSQEGEADGGGAEGDDDAPLEGAASGVGLDAEDLLDPLTRDQREHEQGGGEDREAALDPEPNTRLPGHGEPPASTGAGRSDATAGTRPRGRWASGRDCQP